MPYDPNTGGWTMGPMGGQTQPSTMPPMSPQQVAQIQAQTQQMQQPSGPVNPQQQAMFGGLFNNPNGQGGLGQNLGAAGNALWGNTPAYGGGNILSGDAYGGSAGNPLAGLTAADYG